MATFYKEGKRLAKASCSQPISCTSESCFQWEAKGHHQTDPSQISRVAGQTSRAKNSPLLRGLAAGTAKGQAGPGDRLSLAPTGHTPVRSPPALAGMASGAPYLFDEGSGRSPLVRDLNAARRQGRALRRPGFCCPQLCVWRGHFPD